MPRGCFWASTVFLALHSKVRQRLVKEPFQNGRYPLGLLQIRHPVPRILYQDDLLLSVKGLVHPTGMIGGHEIIAKAVNKAGVKIDSPTGGILGEKPMWMEDGERTTVENTKRLYPGLYASGMAANNVQGGFRMGPIFGGMFKSGRKVAKLIMQDLGR